MSLFTDLSSVEELPCNLVVPVWLRLAERCSDSVEGLVVLLQLVALPAELPVEVSIRNSSPDDAVVGL